MTLLPRREREPAEVIDGVAYYPNRRTMRAVRQAERIARRCTRPHRHRPFASCVHPRVKHAREVKETTIFRKDVKQLKGRWLDLATLETAIGMLADGGEIPPEYDDHGLREPLQKHRACRIDETYYLVYTPEDGKVTLQRIWTESIVEDERNAVTEGYDEHAQEEK